MSDSLYPLVISGNPPHEDLQKAWASIQSEYFKLIKADNIEVFIELASRAEVLKIRIMRYSILADALRFHYYDRIADLIREGDFDVQLDGTDYEADLTRVRSIIRTYEVELKDIETELDNLNEKTKDNKIERVDFTKTLLQISKYQGYELHPDHTTVEVYCLLVAEIKELAEQQKYNER